MIGLDKLGSILKETAKMIKYLALVQSDQRTRLTDSLLAICSRCEDSFNEIYAASEKIRTNFNDTDKLLDAVSEFIQDDELAKKFKPEHLCSEIAQLQTDLRNNLSGLKYSVAHDKLTLLENELGSIHEFDLNLNFQYRLLRDELQNLCDGYRLDGNELSAEIIRDTLNDFRDSIRSVLDSVRASRELIEKNI